MKTFLRWSGILPGAILAAVVAGFILHIILYQTLRNFIEPYPELPERVLFPLVAAIAFQWAGVKIAPSHKAKTTVVLFALWMIFFIANLWFLLSGVKLGDSYLVAHGGGLGPIFAIVGAFAGLYINWKTQWHIQSDKERDPMAI